MKRLSLILIFVIISGCSFLPDSGREEMLHRAATKDYKIFMLQKMIIGKTSDNEFAKIWGRPRQIQKFVTIYSTTEFWCYDYDCNPADSGAQVRGAYYTFCFENNILVYYTKN